MLDSDEYLHLAMRSIQINDHERALEQLHACLEQEPDNGMALFILAGEYADLGMHERAINTLKKSIEIDPSIELAYIHLGLLHANVGQIDEALSTWNDLLSACSTEYLRLMAQGLIFVGQEKIEEGLKSIQEGMRLNNDNADLNQAMWGIVQSLLPDPEASESDDTTHIESPDTPNSARANNEATNADTIPAQPWLGAYKKGSISEN